MNPIQFILGVVFYLYALPTSILFVISLYAKPAAGQDVTVMDFFWFLISMTAVSYLLFTVAEAVK